MNYTENYHLPQWEETDRIMRTDFNQMCADMEAGLTANREAADAGIAEAKTEAAKLPYVVGSYTGTNYEMTFDIGFRPSFLIISGPLCHNSSSSCMGQYNIITAGNTQSKAVTFTDTGFILHDMKEVYYPNLINWKQNYDYIAFR